MEVLGRIRSLYYYEPADWYKWVVLLMASVSQFCAMGVVIGTSLSLYVSYEEEYQERKLSSTIGMTQLTVSHMAGIIGSVLMVKIGVRNIQFIGGFLMTAGFLITGFTKQAWQGFISSGIIVGIGAGFLICSTLSIVSQHFHKRPVPAIAFIQISVSIGSMVMPVITGHLHKTISFLNMFVFLAGLSFTSCVVAIFFFPKTQTQSTDKPDKNTDSKSHQALKIKGKKRGIYHLPTKEESAETAENYRTLDFSGSDGSFTTSSSSCSSPTDSATSSSDMPSFEILDSKDGNCCSEKIEQTNVLNSQITEIMSKSRNIGLGATQLLGLSSLGAFTSPTEVDQYRIGRNHKADTMKRSSLSSHMLKLEEFQVKDLRAEREKLQNSENYSNFHLLISNSHGDSIAALLKSGYAGAKITTLFRDPKVLVYLVQSFLMYVGIAAFWSTSADYFKYTLELSAAVMNRGYVIMGIAMTVISIAYAVFSKFVSFSAMIMNVIITFIYGLFVAAVLLSTTDRTFYIAIGFLGVIRNVYYLNLPAACIELTDTRRGVTLFLIQSIVNGLGGILSPYLAAYLQVEVNSSTAILLSVGFISLALILCLPLSIKMLISPKVYETARQPVQEISIIRHI